MSVCDLARPLDLLVLGYVPVPVWGTDIPLDLVQVAFIKARTRNTTIKGTTKIRTM